MGFKHFVLGYFVDNAAHGYELIKKCFMDFFPVGPEINQGRLYTTLNKLEKESLIERKTKIQEDLPDQKIIYITPQGRKEFNQWLDSTMDEEDKVKFDFFKQYPFLSKVNYYKHMPPEKAWHKFKEQLEISQNRLCRFNEAREEMIQFRKTLQKSLGQNRPGLLMSIMHRYYQIRFHYIFRISCRVLIKRSFCSGLPIVTRI
jgi:DNA-binding PadR family transcriptional regulator